ncbi:MAG: MYXO-CTERM sorting domain-containing protein [Enhygromyxa sp.]
MTSKRRLLIPLAGLCCALVPARAEAKRVVYINTGPVTVLAGDQNDPAADTISVNGYTPTSFAGWNGATEEQRQELLHLLKQTTVYWDVVFTLERPAVGPYDMIVFGDAGDHASAFGGACSPQVGIADCDDGNGVSIGFLFWGCLDESKWFDPHRVAFSVLGALGYSWGMENVSVSGQVMGSYSNFGLKYGDSCVPVSGTSNCNHQLCPAGQQNGTAEMVARHGARVDDGPPELVVLEPAVDALVSGPFDVVVEIIDDFGGVSAELSVVGLDAPPVVDEDWPFRWNNVELPAGSQVLEITAYDFDGGQTTTQVPICVDMCDATGDGDGEPGDGDGDPGDGDPGDGEPGTDDGDEPETTAGGGGFVPIGGEEADVGCSCSSAPGGSALTGLGLLGLLGLGLRRRPRR